jgi:hypothetical protein
VKERSMMNRSYDSKKGKQINHGSELWFLLWILFSVGDCGAPSSACLV